MTTKSRPWLPPQALAPEQLRAILDPAIAAWSRDWFEGPAPVLTPAFKDDWPDGRGASWRIIDDLGAVHTNPLAEAAIAAAMLALRNPQPPGNEMDQRLLAKLAQTALDDLLDRLAKLAGRPGKARLDQSLADLEECRWWELAAGDGGHRLKLGIAVSALVGMVKRGMPPARTPGLSPVAAAIAKAQVKLALGLGSSSLQIGELNGLAAGDVLILSSAVERPLDLLVNGARTALAARLTADDGRPAALVEA